MDHFFWFTTKTSLTLILIAASYQKEKRNSDVLAAWQILSWPKCLLMEMNPSWLILCLDYLSIKKISVLKHITINVGENRRGNQKWTIKRNWYTRRRKGKQKHNVICVGCHYLHTNTTNVNYTWVLLQYYVSIFELD